MTKQLDIEVIQTGLSRNYVGYWTERQAIQEAIQNIAYGVVKSGIPYESHYDTETNLAYIEDHYKGFDKSMLYIGESEQRDDEDGLGNFGEGWKIFMLIMARNGRYHRVDTVGFSFYGKMEKTIHGTEVLNIIVEPNEREKGTRVVFECKKEDFENAIGSFAVLNGIDMDFIKQDSILPGRNHELYIAGVRIEDEDGYGPLRIYYSYNLTNKSLMNRDRTKVDSFEALWSIRHTLGKIEDIKLAEEIIKKASENTKGYQDLEMGPLIPYNNIKVWQEAFRRAYRVDDLSKLAIPSLDIKLNDLAEYNGLRLVKVPEQWRVELESLGIEPVEKKLLGEVFYEETEITPEQKQMLRTAKLKVKRLLKLESVKELPTIKVAKTLKTVGGLSADGLYSKKKNLIVINENAFDSIRTLTRTLLHECVHWKTGYIDNTPEFTRVFEKIIINLLFDKEEEK